MTSPRGPHVVVVGAGAFGGWTALHLLRRGARVTLLDAWGPGNSRASSGGETRILRGIYGRDRLYTDWTARSLRQWREAGERWGVQLFRRTGALWLCGEDDAYARDSLPYLAAAGLPIAELSLTDARARFPQIDFAGLHSTFYEAEAGYLLARRACQAVAAAVAAEGGEVRIAAAAPPSLTGGGLGALRLTDGTEIRADLYLFACGPWLGALFPEAVGERLLRVTRQEIFFFGPPAGDRRFDEGSCPIWMELGLERIFYGIPGNEHRGFKVADDTRGAPFEPTAGERLPSPEGAARARALLGRRFPALAAAPVVEARVCQYENSPDGHLLFGRHPRCGNLWLLGGGSGHGFKLGPALGEHAAAVLLGDGAPDPRFQLDRPGHAAGAAGDTLRTQFDT
jgi:glycine/D-amino acid oxidase-like deaminating enzyme